MTGSLQRSVLLGLLHAFAVLAVAVPGLFGQTSPSPESRVLTPKAEQRLPEFEVASIRPNPNGGIAGIYAYPGGRIRCAFCTLEMLMIYAFDVQPYQVTGGPGWIHREGYTLAAQPPASSESSKANPPSPQSPLTGEQRQMLQALLIDRFQLKFHRESRIGTVYVPTKGGGKLNLQSPKNKNDLPSVWTNGGLFGKNASMPLLALRLSRNLQRPVLDETGLNGAFDFKYEYSDEDSNQNYDDFVASILTSVQGLGLKLGAAKGPVETIVIDHLERPSPN
jgi:uncharacterized protein (TIGR03435 family)